MVSLRLSRESDGAEHTDHATGSQGRVHHANHVKLWWEADTVTATVGTEMSAIYRKLGVSSRGDAVRQATTLGLLGG